MPLLSKLWRRVQNAGWRCYQGVKSERYYPALLPTGNLVTFERAKEEVLTAFHELMKAECEVHNAALVDRYSSEHWKRERLLVQEYAQNSLDASFRRSRVLARQMLTITPGPLRIPLCIAYLLAVDDWLAKRVRRQTLESRIGRPYLQYMVGDTMYSANTVEHLYYLARLVRKTTGEFPRSMIELGGGFGNLARLAQELAPGTTYIDIDYPETLAVAHLNLRLNFPDLAIVVQKAQGDPIVPGAVNLVPVWLAQDLQFQPDVFLSTLALSETSEALRDVFVRNAFYECNRIYVVGSIDQVFNSAPQIQAAVTRLYGASSIHESLHPYIYEVIGTRQPSIR